MANYTAEIIGTSNLHGLNRRFVDEMEVSYRPLQSRGVDAGYGLFECDRDGERTYHLVLDYNGKRSEREASKDEAKTIASRIQNISFDDSLDRELITEAITICA